MHYLALVASSEDMLGNTEERATSVDYLIHAKVA